jgi:hypothetical protein
MDLSLLVGNDTADCVIKDPYTGDDTDIIITVYGPYSKEYTAAFIADSKREESNPLKLIADLTSDWVNVELDGKSLVFSQSNALKVYGMKNSIVKSQVEGFILNGKNFLPKR